MGKGIEILLATLLTLTLAMWVPIPRVALAADADADAAAAAVKLPEVEKKKPTQPVVGLAEDAHLDKTPPRATKGLDLVKMGWSYDCMECHRSIEVEWKSNRARVEHEAIKLDHGNNRFCLTCHNPRNMATFVDYDGAEIVERDVVLLCAKCHGTVHRDWKAGVHGRQNGFWDRSKGKGTRLRCIQCHDPHSPKFKSMPALPGPEYPRRAAGKKGKEK